MSAPPLLSGTLIAFRMSAGADRRTRSRFLRSGAAAVTREHQDGSPACGNVGVVGAPTRASRAGAGRRCQPLTGRSPTPRWAEKGMNRAEA